MHIFKFKYEDIKVAEDIFENGSFIFTFDLKTTALVLIRVRDPGSDSLFK